MPPFLRAVLSVLGSTLAGGVIIYIVQTFSPYQPPMDVTPQNATAFTEWVRNLPTEAYLIVLASYLAGAFVGGLLANLLARGSGYRPAVVTGFVLTIYGIGNFLAFPHPEWLTYASCIGFMVFAWLGGAAIIRKGERERGRE